MCAVTRIEILLDTAADIQIQPFRPGAFGQGQHALRVLGVDIMQVELAVVQPFAQRAGIALALHLFPGFPQAGNRTRCVFGRCRHRGELVALHTDHIGYQYGMVRRQGAAGFGNDCRVRQTVLFTGIADSPDHIIGILIQPVVHRAVRLRTGTFIIHPEAAADIKALNIDTQLMQFDIETGGFTDTGRDIADIRHL